MSGNYIEKFLEEYKSIHANFLDFIDCEENIEESFSNLKQKTEDTKIRACQHKLRLFIHMLLEITNNHHRGPNFFSKIERILQIIKDDIKKDFTNSKIFDIFKTSKRILLFLIEDKIMTVDEYFVKQISNEKFVNMKYPQFFAPEIKPLINDKLLPAKSLIEEINKELPENFYELRKKGENDCYLCNLIREDSVKDFIANVNRNSIPFNAKINLSIFETNLLLSTNEIELIEYAAFFGSIQIFTFLKKEGVELKSSLWKFAIHGKSAEIINLLEDNHVKPEKSFKGCLDESIKCHHNDIVIFFPNNYLPTDYENTTDILVPSLESYYFQFIKKEKIKEKYFVTYAAMIIIQLLKYF